ncbi:MAG: bifunctional nuclease family protein [Bdellovibrionales bacterium]|nr:bifunctional nuclease family protein [Bdellovibrionales bacterium]
MKQTQLLNAEKADSQIVFSNSMEEEKNFKEKDLVRLKPFGLSVSTDFARPFLLLKDEEHKYTLPVAVNPLEAGVALSQANKAVAPTTPHRFTELLLETLHIEIERCVFVELKGHFQFVRLFLKNHPTQDSIKIRADEVMSLCLHLDIPIYASKEYIAKSRVMNAEMDGVSANIQAHPSIIQKNHPYIM